MASPQLENGYTKVANELFDALCCLQLSGHEWSYVMAVMRKTYGYNKKEDWVTNTQIAQMTGLRKERVSEAKKRLVEKKIVTENRNKISLNKNYEEWQELRKTVTGVTENRNKKLRKTVSTKERKKIYKTNTADAVNNSLLTDMKFRDKRRYNEDGHWEEPSIDADTGEELEDTRAAQEEEEKKLNQGIRHNLRLLEGTRGLSFGSGKDFAYHAKIYRELLKNGWSHESIAQTFIDLQNTPYWVEQKELGNYPGMNTVQSLLRNKKPR